MTWFNEPLISPAVGVYCLLGIGAIGVLLALFQRARRGERDPFNTPFGDQ